MLNPPFVNAAVHRVAVGAGGEFLHGHERALDAVLVKPVAPVCAAIVGTARCPLISWRGLLGGHRGGGVNGMMIGRSDRAPCGDPSRRRGSGSAGTATGRRQRLQDVHVVRDGDAIRRLDRQVIIPRRPRERPARHERVRRCAAALRSPDRGWRPGWSAPRCEGSDEQLERLVAVAGHEHLIEILDGDPSRSRTAT